MTNEHSQRFTFTYIRRCVSYLRQAQARKWLLLWMYGVALAHILIGIGLTYFSHHPALQAYHQGILSFFWTSDVPEQAQILQTWWIKLFGATIQFVGILLFLIIYLGHTYKRPLIWWGLILSMLVWVPQDIWISWQANVYSHIIIDFVALICFMLPLCFLVLIDHQTHKRLKSDL